jgi:hypothetical protein
MFLRDASYYDFMEIRGSSTCPRKSASGHFPEPDKASKQYHTLYHGNTF